MSRKYFMPSTYLGKFQWLQNFANKVGNYAAKYGLTAAEVADMVAAALFFAYWTNYTNQYAEYQKKLTQYLAELRDGVPAGATSSVPPIPPVIGVAPPAVDPGIFKRAIAMVGVIKNRRNYTDADGKDLGIEGVDIPATDLINAKPVIVLRLVQGGKPEFVWSKGDFDGIDIWVDRGSGTWVFLATDTYPNYIDMYTLPANGQTALWKYKAIYRYGDDVVGNWSDVVSLAVG